MVDTLLAIARTLLPLPDNFTTLWLKASAIAACLPGNAVLFAARRRVGRLDADAWIITVAIALLIVVPLLLFLAYSAWKEKKRTATLAQAAEGMGFSFLPKSELDFLGDLAGLRLFTLGHGKKLWNLLRGTSRSFEVTIFDYRYTTGSGKSSRTWKQTVICFQSAHLGLPEFSLGPKGFWHKLGSLFGSKGIDFDTHPLFSQNYVLHGTDPDAVRHLFTHRVLEHFEQHLGWSTEGAGQHLLLYKSSKRVAPQELHTLLESGLQVLSLVHTA